MTTSDARPVVRIRLWLPLVLVASSLGGLVGSLVILSPLLAVPLPLTYPIAFAAVVGSVLAAGAVGPVGRPLEVTLALLGAIASVTVAALLGAQQGDPLPAGLVTVGLLLGGASLGAAVGGRIEHPGHLLVVAVISLLVDAFSVFHTHGPAAAVVARPAAIALVALPWPVLGTSEVAPVLGVGDVIFASLYLAASRRHSLGRVRTTIALAIGLLLTGVAVMTTQVPIPALPAMGASMLVAHREARRLPKSDRRKGWVIMGCIALVWLVSWAFR